MKVKYTNPDLPIRDPDTKQYRHIATDPDGEEITLKTFDVPETNFWVRRVLSKELARVDTEPTGCEPIAPLTTR